METLEDDRAELENYSLWNWQPMSEDNLAVSVLCTQTYASAIMSHAAKEKLTTVSLWQWCLSDTTHYCSSLHD